MIVLRARIPLGATVQVVTTADPRLLRATIEMVSPGRGRAGAHALERVPLHAAHYALVPAGLIFAEAAAAALVIVVLW